MAKLTGKKKAAFLKRMALGRKKAQNKRKTTKKLVQKQRKTTTKRRKTTKINTSTKSKSMAKRKTVKKYYRKSKSSFSNFLKGGTMGKVVAGVGAATIAGLVIGQVAPQYSGIAKPIAAYAAGGPAGAITSVILDGGLGSIGGLFGMGATSTPEVGV